MNDLFFELMPVAKKNIAKNLREVNDVFFSEYEILLKRSVESKMIILPFRKKQKRLNISKIKAFLSEK